MDTSHNLFKCKLILICNVHFCDLVYTNEKTLKYLRYIIQLRLKHICEKKGCKQHNNSQGTCFNLGKSINLGIHSSHGW